MKNFIELIAGYEIKGNSSLFGKILTKSFIFYISQNDISIGSVIQKLNKKHSFVFQY